MSSLDYNTLAGADNRHPRAITATTTTMFVLDDGNVKVYSYNHPRSPNTSLSGITVDGNSIPRFFPAGNSFEHGVAHDTPQVTIAATALHPQESVAITPADSDTTTDGHQVSLSAGRNSVTVTVTASNAVATKTYTVSVNRGVDTTVGWKADQDFDTLISADNDFPRAITSDGTTMWVSDNTDDKIYAYNLTTGLRDTDEEFNTLDTAENNSPYGIWSDGTIMWVADILTNTIFAYRMSDKQRDSSKDFNTLAAAGNTRPTGIWSDGTTMWVANRVQAKIYAYRMSNKQHDSSKDFNTLTAADNYNPTGIWSDRDTMWVADYPDNKIYSYNHPVSGDATLSALTVDPRDIIGFAPDDTAYDVGVASTVEQATITAAKSHFYATVAITPADASPDTPGHQVDLTPGRNSVTVTVTAQDGTTTTTYSVDINRGVTDPYGWNAEHDLDALIVMALTDRTVGVAGHAGIIWVTTTQSKRIRAYNLDGTHAATRDITPHTDNADPRHLWTDGTTMWVVDHASTSTIYAYWLSDGARRTELEISLDTDNGVPAGIWSDNQTIWVLDAQDDRVYAYALDGGDRREDREFSISAENARPTGIWADGDTIWVADGGTTRKLFAYQLNTGTRNPSQDFDTLLDVGNGEPRGLWSDGDTMWVSDSGDQKVYSYNMPLAPPANLQAEAGDTRATLSWDDPQNRDITGYQYRVSAADGTTWDPSWSAVRGSSHTTTSLTVGDLTNGVEHRFEVRALESALQSGPAVTRATPMEPPTVPLAPAMRSFYSLDQQTRARWTHPVHDPRVPTTSYDVRYRRYGTSDRWSNVSRTDTDLSTTQLIGGLTNRQGYVIEVAAVNEIGRGPWASGMTAPQGPQSPPSDPTDVAPARFSLGPLGAFWTNGYPATGRHEHRDPLNINLIRTPCAGDTGFTVLWEAHDEEPPEYEAHFITSYGAGTVSHSFVDDSVLPTKGNPTEET